MAAGSSTGLLEPVRSKPTSEPGYHLARGDKAVNAGLRAIGVCAADGSEEYDTVGLGRHRMTEDWLTG